MIPSDLTSRYSVIIGTFSNVTTSSMSLLFVLLYRLVYRVPQPISYGIFFGVVLASLFILKIWLKFCEESKVETSDISQCIQTNCGCYFDDSTTTVEFKPYFLQRMVKVYRVSDHYTDGWINVRTSLLQLIDISDFNIHVIRKLC